MGHYDWYREKLSISKVKEVIKEKESDIKHFKNIVLEMKEDMEMCSNRVSKESIEKSIRQYEYDIIRRKEEGVARLKRNLEMGYETDYDEALF